MNDTMNEITAFSPFGGRLVLEEVKGSATMTERCWRSETGNLMRSVRSIPRYRIRRTIC